LLNQFGRHVAELNAATTLFVSSTAGPRHQGAWEISP
jgi:hypothetical protein